MRTAAMPSRLAPPLPLAVGVLLVAAAGCAAGPSRAAPAPLAAVRLRPDSAVPPLARALLDSLAAARGADDATRPPRGASPLTVRPVTLVVDSTRDLGWLEILADSQLVALVRQALAQNLDLREAQARVREVRAQLGATRSAVWPAVTLNGATSTNQVAFGPQVVAFDAVRATADLSWELDFWGRVRRGVDAARFDLAAQDADLRATTVSLVGTVATTYLQLRELDESVRLSTETLVSRQATLALARRRFAQGVTSELDVAQFEAALAEPAARVAQFSLARVQAENQLAVLLGRPPAAVAASRPLAELVRATVVPASIPGALVARRPDVIAADRALRAATSRVGVASATRLPTVTLSGNYGTQRPDFTRLFAAAGEVYQVQLGVAVPLFDGGRRREDLRAAVARADQARARYERTVVVALREADDALAGVRLTRDQAVAQATQVRGLDRALALATRRYEAGIASYLEVLDAQRQLYAAQLALVQLERQYLGTIVELYRALGSSWSAAAP